MIFQVPYRFIPLSSKVVFPDWGRQVQQDQPFQDGICGELELIITPHTPLCVGGIQSKSIANEPNKVYFFRTPDNKPAIPGSSLKGMLRNVLEIATFSRLKQVEDKKLGVRDITKGENFYSQAIRNPHAGWLRFENNAWRIYPCEFARVHQHEIINYFDITYEKWADKNRKTAPQRYNLIGICPEIQFNQNGHNSTNQVIANISKDGQYQGKLVVTGQPGSFFSKKNVNEPKGAKKYEFIFYHPLKISLEVSAKVMCGFKQIHEKTEEWKFWLRNLSILQHGIPVFFHYDNENQIKSLGLAMMYKLPYNNSIHDAIKHTSPTHLDYVKNHQLDMADLMFGSLGENNNQTNLRGRVNIGLANINADAVNLDWSSATILNSPKPNYYPTYIRQKRGNNVFDQLMEDRAELSGWKRYPSKSQNIIHAPTDASLLVQVKLETLPPTHTFTSKLRFHNLRPIELGALLWCLDFGNRSELRHSLGMGKPYGLGQVSIEIKQSTLRRNDQEDISNVDFFLEDCRKNFIGFMDKALGVTSWLDSDSIRAILYYSKPGIQNLDYQPLENFAECKKAGPKLFESFHATAPKILQAVASGNLTWELAEIRQDKGAGKIIAIATNGDEKGKRAEAKLKDTTLPDDIKKKLDAKKLVKAKVEVKQLGNMYSLLKVLE